MKMNAPKTAAATQQWNKKKITINDNDGNKTTNNTQNRIHKTWLGHGLLF